jgi:hypothetical protein
MDTNISHEPGLQWLLKARIVCADCTHMADKKQPDQTSDPKPEVMKLANEVRSKANSMTDQEREDSFRRGMQLIYGGNSNHGIPAKACRP